MGPWSQSRPGRTKRRTKVQSTFCPPTLSIDRDQRRAPKDLVADTEVRPMTELFYRYRG